MYKNLSTGLLIIFNHVSREAYTSSIIYSYVTLIVHYIYQQIYTLHYLPMFHVKHILYLLYIHMALQ